MVQKSYGIILVWIYFIFRNSAPSPSGLLLVNNHDFDDDGIDYNIDTDDNDNDGIPDSQDTDDDNDLIPDDEDDDYDDKDGVLDVDDGDDDFDNDGLDNDDDTDDDNDGLSDSQDTDDYNDGIADDDDTDDDIDGVEDDEDNESADITDDDGDGDTNDVDTDDNNECIDDDKHDNDNDGITDENDQDDDNDGIADDNDSIRDSQDTDDDNDDGISRLVLVLTGGSSTTQGFGWNGNHGNDKGDEDTDDETDKVPHFVNFNHYGDGTPNGIDSDDDHDGVANVFDVILVDANDEYDTVAHSGDFKHNGDGAPNGILNDKFQSNIKYDKMDKYIYDTFLSFTKSKRHIVLSLDDLKKNDKDLLDILMYDIKEGGGFNYSPTDERNLFRGDIFKIFDNIQSMEIYTNRYSYRMGEDGCFYPLSFIYLLKLIQNVSSLNKVMVRALRPGQTGTVADLAGRGEESWISLLWKKESSILSETYINTKFNTFKKKLTKNTDFANDVFEVIVVDENNDGTIDAEEQDRIIEICKNQDATTCRKEVDASGTELCELQASHYGEPECGAVVRRAGVNGNGGYTAAQNAAQQESGELLTVVGVLGGIIAELVIIIAGGAYYLLHRTNTKQRSVSFQGYEENPHKSVEMADNHLNNMDKLQLILMMKMLK